MFENKMAAQEQLSEIQKIERINQQTFVLTLFAPQIAAAAQPGQFVQASCQKLLRRPIGIMSADRIKGLIQLGFRVQGEGTLWLSGRKAGDHLSLLGPLGHGFMLDGYERIITVGGGTGVFPLYFVQQICRERGIEALAVCGYRSREESVLREAYSQLGCRTLFAADAGDLDIPGHAGLALEELLKQLPPIDGTAVLTCGPRPMMQAVADIARQHGYACQVSLEERMACGIGVCLVCACKVKQEAGETGYARCCVDGPVFSAEEVVWES